MGETLGQMSSFHQIRRMEQIPGLEELHSHASVSEFARRKRADSTPRVAKGTRLRTGHIMMFQHRFYGCIRMTSASTTAGTSSDTKRQLGVRARILWTRPRSHQRKSNLASYEFFDDGGSRGLPVDRAAASYR